MVRPGKGKRVRIRAFRTDMSEESGVEKIPCSRPVVLAACQYHLVDLLQIVDSEKRGQGRSGVWTLRARFKLKIAIRCWRNSVKLPPITSK